MRHLEYVIDGEYDGKKVLHYLRGRAGLSTRLVNSLKRQEMGITLNGAHARTIDILREGDILAVNMPEDSSQIEPIHYDLDIVFEDSDILIINKPAGLAMHPTHNHQGDTLANAVTAYYNEKGQNVAFRAVGRLDKGTSGLVICALNKHAAWRLSGKFSKEYYAVAAGEFMGQGTIDKRISRPDPMKTLRAAGEVGDDAVTHWEALWTDGTASLLKIHLDTGRTHQIRVHFASCGSPLAGDAMYGSRDERILRPALHCAHLRLTHPVSGQELSFFADFPEDFKALLPESMKNLIK